MKFAKEGEYTSGKDIPQNAKGFTSDLSYVGGEQNREGKVFFSYAFQNQVVMSEVIANGIGVFVAYDLPQNNEEIFKKKET